MKKRVTILGSTGSIGCNTLRVLASLEDHFEVCGLAAGSRWEQLAKQCQAFKPTCVAIADSQHEHSLAQRVDSPTRVLSGADGIVELIEASECDIVVSAIVGAAGLAATLRAAELGKRVAIANKETLVIAGPVIKALAEKSKAELIPVDSEHSAVFQALHAGHAANLKRIYLTSSGGPFRTWTIERIRGASLSEALSHPVWDMGPKISIDSATMMNKALEIVEARWLFDVPRPKIDVLVHPQATIHSMVEFCDGCIIAQLGSPDMRTPIQYALTYPQRLQGEGDFLDVMAMKRLDFEPPDIVRFPALQLGFDVAEKGGSAGAVLNAANEASVKAFRDGLIKFGEIADLVADTLSSHRWIETPSLPELLDADQWARNEVSQCLKC